MRLIINATFIISPRVRLSLTHDEDAQLQFRREPPLNLTSQFVISSSQARWLNGAAANLLVKPQLLQVSSDIGVEFGGIGLLVAERHPERFHIHFPSRAVKPMGRFVVWAGGVMS